MTKRQIQYVSVTIAVIVASFFVGYAMVSAHGSGESFEKEIDGLLVDIGYSVETFTDDTSVIFDFDLQNEDGSGAAFTDIWVRIVRDEATVFASGINNARLGGAIMTYVFPTPGDYELSARFQNDGEKIAEASFPLTVEAGTSTNDNDFTTTQILTLISVLIVGVLSGLLFTRFKKA